MKGGKMIGLKDGTVIVIDYDESWKHEFEKEKDEISKAFAGKPAVIEHFGSTSISGLCAKPIIDILIGIDRFDAATEYIRPMETIGYTFKGENGIPFRNFFIKGDPRTHHVHMVDVNSALWKEQLRFRDYLRTHPEEIERYADLKRKLARRYPDDRDRYLSSKAGFIQGIIGKAKAGEVWNAGDAPV